MRTLAGLALMPEVEPVVVLGNDSDRPAYGDRQSVSGTTPVAPRRPGTLGYGSREPSGCRGARSVSSGAHADTAGRASRTTCGSQASSTSSPLGGADHRRHRLAGRCCPRTRMVAARDNDARRPDNETACPRLEPGRPRRPTGRRDAIVDGSSVVSALRSTGHPLRSGPRSLSARRRSEPKYQASTSSTGTEISCCAPVTPSALARGRRPSLTTVRSRAAASLANTLR